MSCQLFVRATRRDLTVARELKLLCQQCAHYWPEGNCCTAPPDMLFKAEQEAKEQDAGSEPG